ncbi:unnamed protein product [Rotaria sordida]|uniref:Uncharacterized protein n=1 Tax=Rotaria sordida TaxID=392033 RepID=A0A819KTS5_9BILA|nr:unnamed protein product [Rotaria sordida]CAF3950117.1 unnamed protein product [Rotaria sordida]
MIDLRKRVFSMLGQKGNLKNIDVVKHFVLEGFERSTVYDAIKCCEIGLPVEDRPRSGCPTSFNKSDLKRSQNEVENRVGFSYIKHTKLKCKKNN